MNAKYVTTALCLLALSAGLAACGKKSETSDVANIQPAEGEVSATGDMQGVALAATPTDVNTLGAPVVESPSAENGAPAVPPGMRGTWASNASSCRDGWWKFDEQSTETSRGVKCTLTGLSAPEGSPSTTLILSCKGEGMTNTEQWEVSAPQGGQLMLIRHMAPDGKPDGGGAIPLLECPAMVGSAGAFLDRV